MTKKEIIEIVAQRTGQRKNHTKVIIECVFDVFIETLARERRIEVRNFGVFRVKETPARIGRNPVTKESADVPARNIVQFKAGKYMKDIVAGAVPASDNTDGGPETRVEPVPEVASKPDSAPSQPEEGAKTVHEADQSAPGGDLQ